MVSFAAELAGDVAKMAQVENLGILLNEVYPDGSKAPDDFDPLGCGNAPPRSVRYS